MNRIARGGGSAPFGEVNRKIRLCSGINDGALADGIVCGCEQVIAQIQKGIAVGIKFTGGADEAVAVITYEIERRIAGVIQFEERFDPVRACASGTTDEVIGIRAFGGGGGVVVKLKVFFAGARWIAWSTEAGIIRFVPDFKIPSRHFVRARAFGPVRDEVVDEAVLFFVGLGG